MKKFFISFLLIISSLVIFAQDVARHNIYIELGGVSGLYSVNYEHLLRNDRNLNFALRIGFAYDFNNTLIDSRYILPLSFSLLKNLKNNHFLELRFGLSNDYSYVETSYESNSGLGDTNMTFNYYKKTEYFFEINPSFGIGYRYQPESKEMFFNFLIQKIKLSKYKKNKWHEFISIGIGYAF